MSFKFRDRVHGFTRVMAIAGVLAFMSVGALSVAAIPAVADAATVPGLASTNMYGPLTISDLVCDPGGISTFDFTSTGYSTYPYEGVFRETGHVSFGPQDHLSAGVAFPVGTTMTMTAAFTITASNGDAVTGTKQLVAQDAPFFSDNRGICERGTLGSGSYVDWFCSNTGGTGVYLHEDNFALVTSTIKTTSGTYSDNNWAHVYFDFADFTCGYGYHQLYPGSFQEANYLPYGSPILVSPPAPDSLTLSPASATSPVGTSHTVTATATAAGAPFAGASVLLKVAGSVSTTGSCTTGTDGTCSFTYTGPDLPGADAITACVDNNSNGACDSGEPTAEATKAWLLPTATAGQVTGGGQIPNSAGNAKIAFGFTAKSASTGIKGECSVIDIAPATNIKVKCTDVIDLTVSGTHATLFGDATVNGVATTYRIDANDYAEPGTGVDTFKIQTASGYAASGTLVGGNNQVH